MLEVWYVIAVFMLVAYVVLDGFDFGAGALHLVVAREDAERRALLAAVGPFWDGNEVWLLAAGGTLFVAFPRVLAAGVSGFYFAIFMVLWCVILRGVAIEFRGHVRDPLWATSWDFLFWVPSTLLPVFFGAALGNLLRGLPLDAEGWFSLPLFTDFSATGVLGILDWYTVLVGVFALVALAAHGAAFLAWKTEAALQRRSLALGRALYLGVALLWPILTVATQRVNADFLPALGRRPIAWLFTLVAGAGLAVALGAPSRGRHLAAFLGSGAFLSGLSAATAAVVFPVMLRSVTPGVASITAYDAGGDPRGLAIGLRWFLVGFPLVIVYFATVFRLHRGKVRIEDREVH